MGIGEGTCGDRHWVLCVVDGTLGSAPETSIALYVDYNLNKTLKLQKIKIKKVQQKLHLDKVFT